MIEAWMLARTPLNLREYAEIDVYWYRELRAALAAWEDGRGQKRELDQLMARVTASHRTQ